MKLKTILSLLACTITVATANAQNSIFDGAILTERSGSVATTGPEGEPTELAIPLRLAVNSVVQTQPGGRAVLVFKNGATVVLTGDSKLLIRSANVQPFTDEEANLAVNAGREPSTSNIVLELEKGKAIATVRELNDASLFVIITPQGQIIGRDALYSVSTSPMARQTVVINASGNVRFGGSGSRFPIESGTKVVITSPEGSGNSLGAVNRVAMNNFEGTTLSSGSENALASVSTDTTPSDIKVVFNATSPEDSVPSGDANQVPGQQVPPGAPANGGGFPAFSTDPTPVDNSLIVSPT